jgi:hypothetical protein
MKIFACSVNIKWLKKNNQRIVIYGAGVVGGVVGGLALAGTPLVLSGEPWMMKVRTFIKCFRLNS